MGSVGAEITSQFWKKCKLYMQAVYLQAGTNKNINTEQPIEDFKSSHVCVLSLELESLQVFISPHL